jgi:predicted transcriptional regulator
MERAVSAFYDLMFEVSNEDRVRILNALSKEPCTNSDLSCRLSLTSQEVSRHVQRLTNYGLMARRNDGLLVLSPFGELLLRQLASLHFINAHRRYFADHVISGLPERFMTRISELGACAEIEDVMVAVHRAQRLIEEAEEYILNINMRYFSSGFAAIKAAFDREVKGYFLHGLTLRLPREMAGDRRRVFPKGYVESLKGAGTYLERLLDVPLILYLSEKDVALLCFPKVGGEFDFKGFAAGGEEAHKWCRDLFQYYWDKAKPIL